MNIKQREIADYLDISITAVHFILTGQRPVSWPIAEKLTRLFPGKDIIGWKNASPEELKRAFTQIDREEA